MTPTPNTELAVAFLVDVVAKTGRIDLGAINPDLPNKHPDKLDAATFFPNQPEKIRKWITERQGKLNLYVSPNQARDDARPNWRLSESSVGFIRAIYADIDPVKLAEGDASGRHFREEHARLYALAKQLSKDAICPPSIIVDSGGGIQPWWLLDKPLPATPENVELAKGIGRTLKARFGGDGVFDVCRLMRVPGTINIPGAYKAAQGRTPALASILIDESSQRTYTLNQIAERAPPTPEHAKPKGRPAAAIDMDAVEIGIPYEDLPEALRQKFEAYCASRPTVGALWRGKPAPWQGGESPSEYVFALSTTLRPSGAFTITEFAQLVGVWKHRSETHADDFERYVSRAWNRNPAPLGGEGFDAVEIGERNVPPKDTEKALDNSRPGATWDDPADLWTDRAEVVDLPEGVVPAIIERAARDRGRRLGVEAGALAAGIVTTLGSLIHAGNRMQPRQHDTKWTVKPITWTALIGDSGKNKSATLGYGVEPAKELQTKWNRDYAFAVRAHTASQPMTPAEGKKSERRQQSNRPPPTKRRGRKLWPNGARPRRVRRTDRKSQTMRQPKHSARCSLKIQAGCCTTLMNLRA
jgi:Protein of unknown function (DUF3987)/RepB DNA-primase from phage plasmid